MFLVPSSGVVQVAGADAVKIVNNLCTNDLKQLAVASNCEAFITNVRGWCVEHGFVLKLENEILFVGQLGNPAGLGSHIDRYIVREDAKVNDLSPNHALLLLSREEANRCQKHFGDSSAWQSNSRVARAELAGHQILSAAVNWLHTDDLMFLVQASEADALIQVLSQADIKLESHDAYEQARVASFWPLAGAEILEKSIPQELDRDSRAISFTKGCYLGQETIARLDAIGQLQKKLCLVRIESTSPIERGTQLLRNGQQVGNVTSSATSPEPNQQLALAYLRRGNFDAGTQLQCGDAAATVIDHQVTAIP